MGVEKFDRQRDQVVEVDRLVGLQRRRVTRIGERGKLLGLALGVLQCEIRRDERILPVGNQRLQATDRRLVGAAGEIGNDAVAVGRVEDRETRLVTEHLGLFAQDAYAQRVEGRDREPLGLAAEQLRDALLHFLRRLVGERDGSDVRRRKAAVLNEVSDFLRDHPRLARPGASQNQQRTVKITNGFTLGGVE